MDNRERNGGKNRSIIVKSEGRWKQEVINYTDAKEGKILNEREDYTGANKREVKVNVKTHKPGNKQLPITSPTRTPTYQLSKTLYKLLTPNKLSKYSPESTSDFVSILKNKSVHCLPCLLLLYLALPRHVK